MLQLQVTPVRRGFYPPSLLSYDAHVDGSTELSTRAIRMSMASHRTASPGFFCTIARFTGVGGDLSTIPRQFRYGVITLASPPEYPNKPRSLVQLPQLHTVACVSSSNLRRLRY